MPRKSFYVPRDRTARAPFSVVADMAKVSLATERLQAAKFPAIPALPLSALRRYHVATGLHPDYLPEADAPLALVLSRHAVESAQRELERKGIAVHLPVVLDLTKVRLVEQGIYRDMLDRILVRLRHDAHWDLVLSILWRVREDSPKGLITAWLNESGDRHATLDRRLYARP